jgi:hypothetical protein
MGEAKRRGMREQRVAQAIQKQTPSLIDLSKMQSLFVRDLAMSGARFLLIGGKAMQAVGIERETTDVDIWVDRDDETVECVFSTLKKVCGAPDIFRERLRNPNVRVPIPTEQNPEIDILTSVGDLSFDEIHRAAEEISWQSIALRVPRLGDLIRIKEVAIASTEKRIVGGEWDAAGIQEARRGIARDQRDIDLLRQRQV